MPDSQLVGQSIFTVDVEDWFHILDVRSSPPISKWGEMPSRVEANFTRLLDLFSEKRARVTCFFLGWIAERFPHLVNEAARRGHEIASHGYGHGLIFRMTQQEFRADALRSRKLLEDVCGKAVVGYRAPGFSVIEETPWFFDELASAGYQYDSSVFPISHGHGGMQDAERSPYVIAGSEMVEFPITVANVLGKPMCLFGGGYLRLAPEWLILAKARQVLREKRPVIFYIHPREIDPEQPRLKMSFGRKFKCYVNLNTTMTKLVAILDNFPLTTISDFMLKNPLLSSLQVTERPVAEVVSGA